MNTRTLRPYVAVLGVALVVLVAGCGDDESDAAGSSTTAVADGAAGASTSEFQVEAEERGKPEMAATDPVDELVVTDDVEGTGTEVQPGDTVTAHYVGVAASSGEEFDSSWDRGAPLSFPLDQVIQGWSEGMVGMKEGGRRTLVIPAEMAYGDSGPAPGDTLVFTIDLVKVN